MVLQVIESADCKLGLGTRGSSRDLKGPKLSNITMISLQRSLSKLIEYQYELWIDASFKHPNFQFFLKADMALFLACAHYFDPSVTGCFRKLMLVKKSQF